MKSILRIDSQKIYSKPDESNQRTSGLSRFQNVTLRLLLAVARDRVRSRAFGIVIQMVRDYSMPRPATLGKHSIQTCNDCCMTAACQRNRDGGSAKGHHALAGWGRLRERGFGGCTGHGAEWAIGGPAFSG